MRAKKKCEICKKKYIYYFNSFIPEDKVKAQELTPIYDWNDNLKIDKYICKVCITKILQSIILYHI